MKSSMRTLALVAALACGSSLVHADSPAGNLVVNGGFETGDFTGWTLSGLDVPGQQDNLYGVEGLDPFPTPGGTAPNSGNYQAFFSDITSNATTLSQVLATTPGAYLISFYLAQQLEGPGSVKNSVVVSLDGTTVVSLTAVPVEGYTLYTFSTAVTDTASTLSLTFGNDIGEFLLDDVSVTAIAPAVPEPAIWAQFGAGLFAMGLVARRRRLIPKA